MVLASFRILKDGVKLHVPCLDCGGLINHIQLSIFPKTSNTIIQALPAYMYTNDRLSLSSKVASQLPCQLGVLYSIEHICSSMLMVWGSKANVYLVVPCLHFLVEVTIQSKYYLDLAGLLGSVSQKPQ